MATLKVCARCKRSPLGVFKPVRSIRGQRYCLTCAVAVEDSEIGTDEAKAPAPVKAAPVKAARSLEAPKAEKRPPKPPSSSVRYYCTQCRSHSNTAKMKGNGWIELLLYLFYILPGVIYSVWRRSGKPNGCPTCGHATLVPAGVGEDPSPDTHVRCPDCAELVRREARKCKHCGCALVPQSQSEQVSST